VLGGNVEKQVDFVNADAAIEENDKPARITVTRRMAIAARQVVNAGA